MAAIAIGRVWRKLSSLAALDRTQSSSRVEFVPSNVVVALIFFASLMHSFWAVAQGWWNPILELHDFRQTQTAISAFFMLQGGPWLAYETPVLGAPWSIPFEFPLYQWLVVITANTFGAPLDQTGRMVSVIFFYLSLVPAYMFLASLGIPRAGRLVFLTLFLTSPLYLFWSRSFMIESTALFLGLSYLYCVAAFLKNRKLRLLVAACVFGALGALVKVTTFFGFGFAALLVTSRDLWLTSDRNVILSKIRHYVLLAISAAAIPFALLVLWTNFADTLKRLNPLARDFITSDRLSGWNFGSIEQRFSADFWFQSLYQRMLPDLLGNQIVFAALLVLVIFSAFGKVKNRGYIFAAIATFLSVMLVFTNLHIVHNYYQYANGLFLIGAVGFAIQGQLQSGWLRSGVALAVFFYSAYSGLQTYSARFLPGQQADITGIPLVAASKAIRAVTQQSDALLIYGNDWNSALPYYSQRRAIMNFHGFSDMGDKYLGEALSKLGDTTLGAMVVCNTARLQAKEVRLRLKMHGFSQEFIYQNDQCDVYLPESSPLQRSHSIPSSAWELEGGWSIGGAFGSIPNAPGATYVFGSWSGSDSNTGLLRSTDLMAKDVSVISIPVVCGPSVSGLELVVEDSDTGEKILGYPMSSCRASWSDWVLTGHELGFHSRFRIVARDQGAQWGQWMAIGEPSLVTMSR